MVEMIKKVALGWIGATAILVLAAWCGLLAAFGLSFEEVMAITTGVITTIAVVGVIWSLGHE